MTRCDSEEPVQVLSASLGAEILLKVSCKANEMFSSCCEDQLFSKNFEVSSAFQNCILKFFSFFFFRFRSLLEEVK